MEYPDYERVYSAVLENAAVGISTGHWVEGKFFYTIPVDQNIEDYKLPDDFQKHIQSTVADRIALHDDEKVIIEIKSYSDTLGNPYHVDCLTDKNKDIKLDVFSWVNENQYDLINQYDCIKNNISISRPEDIIKVLKFDNSIVEMNYDQMYQKISLQQVKGIKLTVPEVCHLLHEVKVNGISLWSRGKRLHHERKNPWKVIDNYGPSGAYYSKIIYKPQEFQAAYKIGSKLDISMNGKPYLEKSIWLGDLYPIIATYCTQNHINPELPVFDNDNKPVDVISLRQEEFNYPGQRNPWDKSEIQKVKSSDISI